MIENWRKIENFDYEVSDLGRVKNIQTGKILKPVKVKKGYLYVTLYKNKIPHVLRLNRLVCIAFHGKSNLQAAHIDNNRENNLANNLCWKTNTENQADRIVHGTTNRGERCGTAKLSREDVLEIRKLLETGKYFQRQIGEIFGVRQSLISRIKNKKSWQYD